MLSDLPIGLDAQARSPGFHEIRWGAWDVALVFAPVLIHAALVSIGRRPFIESQALSRWVGLFAYLATYAWMMACPAWIAYRRGYRWTRRPVGRSVWPEVAIAIGYVALSIVMTQVIFLGASALNGEAARPGPTHEGSFRSSALASLTFTVFAVTIGPIAEEIAFRGVLHNALERRLPMPVACLLQGLAFGVYHPFDTANRAAIAAMGCLLGLIYRWRKTLFTPVLCHSLMNGFASALMAYLAWGYPDGPVLGVRGSDEAGGCRVVEVVPGGAAEAVGLRVGDVITAIDETPIANFRQMVELIATHKAGESVRVRFSRNGEERVVPATLKRRGGG